MLTHGGRISSSSTAFTHQGSSGSPAGNSPVPRPDSATANAGRKAALPAVKRAFKVLSGNVYLQVLSGNAHLQVLSGNAYLQVLLGNDYLQELSGTDYLPVLSGNVYLQVLSGNVFL